MRISMTCAAVIISMTTSLFATASFGWGQRGHHSICAVATRLLQDQDLAQHMNSRKDLLGHVCNLPDVSWRNQGEATKSGDEAHFLDPQNLDLMAKDVPLSIADIYAQYQGKPSKRLGRNIDVAKDLGTIWWRMDQFFRVGFESAKKAIDLSKTDQTKAPKTPSGMTPTDQAIYDMVTAFGLMGHFVGDASQPMHNDVDYDGWDVGHGGLHSYYESRVVDALPLDLDSRVFAVAKKYDWSQLGSTTIERMRSMSTVAQSELSKVIELDKVESPSGADANGVKYPARRKSPRETAHLFADLIIEQMARSASLLAFTMDLAVAEAKSDKTDRIPFSKYRSYNYPLDTPFIGLDYLP